jgi:GNAT superfamily N-acetyltransferase
MFPLTFQVEQVLNMSADTVRLVQAFIAANMARDVPDDHVYRHSYCVFLYTSPGLCLSALVLVRVEPEHVNRRVHELNSLCVETGHRACGLGSELLRYTREQLTGSDYLKLYVDAGPDHDRLVRFYHRNGMFTLYENTMETCLQSKRAVDWVFWRRLAGAVLFLLGVAFVLSAVHSAGVGRALHPGV